MSFSPKKAAAPKKRTVGRRQPEAVAVASRKTKTAKPEENSKINVTADVMKEDGTPISKATSFFKKYIKDEKVRKTAKRALLGIGAVGSVGAIHLGTVAARRHFSINEAIESLQAVKTFKELSDDIEERKDDLDSLKASKTYMDAFAEKYEDLYQYYYHNGPHTYGFNMVDAYVKFIDFKNEIEEGGNSYTKGTSSISHNFFSDKDEENVLKRFEELKKDLEKIAKKIHEIGTYNSKLMDFFEEISPNRRALLDKMDRLLGADTNSIEDTLRQLNKIYLILESNIKIIKDVEAFVDNNEALVIDDKNLQSFVDCWIQLTSLSIPMNEKEGESDIPLWSERRIRFKALDENIFLYNKDGVKETVIQSVVADLIKKHGVFVTLFEKTYNKMKEDSFKTEVRLRFQNAFIEKNKCTLNGIEYICHGYTEDDPPYDFFEKMLVLDDDEISKRKKAIEAKKSTGFKSKP